MNFQEYGATVTGELAKVFDRMNDASVQPLLDAIKAAKQIFVFGYGREGISLRGFAMRLAHLGKTTHWAMDDTSTACQPGDLYITSCGGGGNDGLRLYAEKAKAAGAKIALITTQPSSPFTNVADVVTILPAYAYLSEADMVPTIQLMGNQYEQALYILGDILVMMLKDQLGLTPDDLEARHRNIE
ncbi:MAG: SIS domain-containing protein [Christensenellales bacterium]|jgi:6-phospho-3-hexuloisomerase